MNTNIPILFKYSYDCCGCGACAVTCPKQAITMIADREGFLYPEIDQAKCVSCLLCMKVCPIRAKKNEIEK